MNSLLSYLLQKRAEQKAASPVPQEKPKVAVNENQVRTAPVSSSPFNNKFNSATTAAPTDSSNGSSQEPAAEFKPGKLKINSQFLQANSTTSPTTAPTRTVNKMAAFSGNGTTSSYTNGATAHSSQTSVVNSSPEASNTSEPNSGTSNGGHSLSDQHDSAQEAVEPSPTNNHLYSSPPAYLRAQNESEEEDEWNETGPVKIAPIQSAPLATLETDENSYTADSTPDKNSSGNYDQNDQNDQYQFQETGQDSYVQEAAPPANGGQVRKLTAVAIYDYQAADSDEISFDPNDIITDIVQVSHY